METKVFVQPQSKSDVILQKGTEKIFASVAAGLIRNGKEVEMRATQTHIQWKYTADTEWIDLFAIGDTIDKTYVHNQIAASKDWVITHNLNKYPSVAIVDSANTVVIGDVEYPSLDVINIHFVGEFAGKAYLN